MEEGYAYKFLVRER